METTETDSQRLKEYFYDAYLMPGTMLSIPKRYKDLRLMSSSPRAMTFGAVDEVTRDQVAVKYVSNLADVDLAKYTLREIRLFLRSNHPNVVKMVNVLSPQVCLGEPNLDIVYIVLEKVQASLTHVINMARVGKHKLTQKHTSFMLYQILCGVKYLHKSGITHMDLKPDCIGVNEKGCAVKLFGFGLGRKRPDNLKMSPYVVTRFYRAPELLLEMDFDNRVDTWSIGCILAEMILKKVLFPGQNYFTQWTAIVSVLGKPKKEFFDKLKPKTREFALQTGPLPGKTVDELVPDNLAQSEDREPINLLNAKSFLDTVLKIDPALRSTVEEALKHPYVNYWYDKTEAEVPGMKDVKEMEIRMLNEEKSLEDYKGLIRRELDTYQRQPSNNVLGKPPPDTIYSGPFPILR